MGNIFLWLRLMNKSEESLNVKAQEKGMAAIRGKRGVWME